ncbi:MAG: hypothetical protein N2749_06255 [Clostridia bacterium]|nr:hypothetical protein [Clostridia bacterium]
MNSSIINIICDIKLYYSIIQNFISIKDRLNTNSFTLILIVLIKDLSVLIREIEKYEVYHSTGITLNSQYFLDIKKIRNQLKFCDYEKGKNKTNKQSDIIMDDIKQEYGFFKDVSIFLQNKKIVGSDMYTHHIFARIDKLSNLYGKYFFEISKDITLTLCNLKKQYEQKYECTINTYSIIKSDIYVEETEFVDYKFSKICRNSNIKDYELYRLLTTITEISSTLMLMNLINNEQLNNNYMSVYSITKMLCVKYVSIIENLKDLKLYEIKESAFIDQIYNFRNTHHYKEIFEEFDIYNFHTQIILNSWCKQIKIQNINSLFDIKDYIIDDMKLIQEKIRSIIRI